MLQLIIRDLFAFDTPLYLSFGLMPDPYHYKSSFSTNYSHAADVLVLRNTPQNRFYAFMNRMMNGSNKLRGQDDPYEPDYTQGKSAPAET